VFPGGPGGPAHFVQQRLVQYLARLLAEQRGVRNRVDSLLSMKQILDWVDRRRAEVQQSLQCLAVLNRLLAWAST
jgi:hypothetical protein